MEKYTGDRWWTGRRKNKMEKYCNVCGYEISYPNWIGTMYQGKKFCNRKTEKDLVCANQPGKGFTLAMKKAGVKKEVFK